MRWFSHENNLRYQNQFLQMGDLYGELVGYGLGVLIWEVVAQYTERTPSPESKDTFRMPLAGKFNLDFWARELHVHDRQLSDKKVLGRKKAVWELLCNAAACGVIDNDALHRDAVVYAPALQDHLDDFAARKARGKTPRKKQQVTGEPTGQ